MIIPNISSKCACGCAMIEFHAKPNSKGKAEQSKEIYRNFSGPLQYIVSMLLSLFLLLLLFLLLVVLAIFPLTCVSIDCPSRVALSTHSSVGFLLWPTLTACRCCCCRSHKLKKKVAKFSQLGGGGRKFCVCDFGIYSHLSISFIQIKSFPFLLHLLWMLLLLL